MSIEGDAEYRMHRKMLSYSNDLMTDDVCVASKNVWKVRESANYHIRFMQKRLYKTEQMCYNERQQRRWAICKKRLRALRGIEKSVQNI